MRLRDNQGAFGRSTRLSPIKWRISRCTAVLSHASSLRPRTSRAPVGDVTQMIGPLSHFGPRVTLVTGPPESRSSSCPMWYSRIAFICCLNGSGFLGTSGRDPTSCSLILTMSSLLRRGRPVFYRSHQPKTSVSHPPAVDQSPRSRTRGPGIPCWRRPLAATARPAGRLRQHHTFRGRALHNEFINRSAKCADHPQSLGV
jgi:hypothetical protein